MLKTAFQALNQTLSCLLIMLIRGYQLFISPYTGYHCRFTPTCSQYALTAIKRFGCLKGCYFALKRLLCCHPFHCGGDDPVPSKPQETL